MNIVIWHVHGSWTTAFVQGGHRYLVPVVPGRGPEGRGRARTFEWPANVVEIGPDDLADADIDVVVLQRRLDEHLLERWTGLRAGRDLPAVWLEHNAPQGRIEQMRHPAADRDDVLLVHVTHTNAVFWDAGRTPTTVIEHGIVDPGHRYTGELASAAVVVNEPLRRGRVTGTDLLERLSVAAPVELFGMGALDCAEVVDPGGERVRGHENLVQCDLHAQLARRRVYAHPVRWTSLGLSLIEAMHLGMPVVALATTEVPEAVPPTAGIVTNDLDRFTGAVRDLIADPDRAAAMGEGARRAALERFGLERFLSDWDRLLKELA